MESLVSTWIQVLVSSLLVALGGILTWIIRSRLEGLRKVEETLRRERTKIYADVLAPYIDVLSDPKGPGADRAARRLKSLDYKRAGFQMVLLGGDDVIRAWNEFMQYVYRRKEGQDDLADMVTRLGRILLEIRKSLGNKRTKLNELDMLRWLIKDIQKIESQFSSHRSK